MNILNKILLIPLKQLLLIIFLFPISISAEDLKLFDRFYLGGGTGLAGNELEALGDRANNFALLNFELIDRRRSSGMLSYIQFGKDWQFDNNFVILKFSKITLSRIVARQKNGFIFKNFRAIF